MRYRVWVSPHAMEQWRERVGTNIPPAALARWIAKKIRTRVQSTGLTFNARGACCLELRPGLKAVVTLNERGPGWAVLTFTFAGDPDELRLPG